VFRLVIKIRWVTIPLLRRPNALLFGLEMAFDDQLISDVLNGAWL
jgi:hypothetical protein